MKTNIRRFESLHKNGTITDSDFEERCSNLLRRYEEMLSRLGRTQHLLPAFLHLSDCYEPNITPQKRGYLNKFGKKSGLFEFA